MQWFKGTLFLVVGLVALVGCQPEKKDGGDKGDKAQNVQPDASGADKAADKAADKGDKPGQAPPVKGPGDVAQPAPNKLEGPCGDYSAALCKEAGEQSDICAASKAMAPVMSPKACTAGMDDMAFTVAALKKRMAKCEELITKLCTDLGEETQSCLMVRSVTKTFPPDRCVAMLAEYPAVLAELKKREDANKPLTPELQAEIAGKDAPGFGNPDSKVTVVEFSDFQCPYCSKAADVTTELKKKYGDKIRVVFRQFPLSFHPEAHISAQASLEAAKQGKFWEYHDLLFKNQKALKREDLDKYAKEVGLDEAAFKKAMDDKVHAKAVDADMAMGGKVNVEGTPTMFINGVRVSNPSDIALVSSIIDGAMSK